MNENNDEKIKKMLESENVPEELSPGNIKKMLDEKAPVKKRKKITHKAAKITAGAAACAVICGFGVHYAEQGNLFNKDKDDLLIIDKDDRDIYDESSQESASVSGEQPKSPVQNTFMDSASDYGELYYMLEKAYENYRFSSDNYDYYGMKDTNSAITDGAAIQGEVQEEAFDDIASGSETVENPAGDSAENSFSETYNQEEGVLEADIAKTDGKYIYYLYTKYDYSKENSPKHCINVAETDNGLFAASNVIDISADFPVDENGDDSANIILHDMYLYNDMLIVMGEVRSYSYYSGNEDVLYDDYCGWGNQDGTTFVNVYTTGIDPQLIGTYSQDGYYNDVRITPEGYMYLITNDYSENYGAIEDIDDFEAYIPSYSAEGESCLIPPENILIPGELEECSSISYTIIGSLDLNSSGTFTETDIKAIAGFSGEIYCSGTNLYTASGWDETAITRIALENGIITPAASGTVKGYINDQFSMSEYDGYFRIATTIETWSETIFDEFASYGRDGIDNCVYVLDMDLNEVGKIDGFGIDETIKSVNFSGDTAYVVTYEQTDPLFAIDLSDPQQPVILDEFKILGYSTYMQQWSDGLLLGFGANADENGIEDGVKLVMFDNSDPNALDEAGIYIINGSEDSYCYSEAIWERKALLIAPEKNLIGVPVENNGYQGDEWLSESKYLFFSYANGEFRLLGEISAGQEDYYFNEPFNRAVYIGDFVYALSGGKFVSADISAINVTDTAVFD